MSKQILFTTEARKALLIGINKVADATRSTMGANGRNVLISHNRTQKPETTKDGVRTAKSISLPDPVENAAALLTIGVAEKTVELAGDGTTASILLFQQIVNQAFWYIENGSNSVEIKKGIEKAAAKVVEGLKEQSLPIGDSNEIIKNIATVSANNDEEIGGLIAKAFKVIGNDGIIVIEEGTKAETQIRIDDGYQFDRGATSPFWWTNQEKAICELRNPLILIVDGKIDKMKDLEKFFKGVVAKQKKEILIIADMVEGEAMDTFIVNKLKGVLDIVVVHAPSFGETRREIMKDLCIATGGKYVSDTVGLRLCDVTIDDCGTCERLVVTKDKSTIVGGYGSKEEIASRSNQMKSLIEQSESEIEKKMLLERLGKLNEGIAVFSVGGITETEMKEKKDRVDDAIRATKCAIEEGIVPGGGIALLRCVSKLSSIKTDNKHQKIGVSIIKEILEAPLRQILLNAGIEGKKSKWELFWISVWAFFQNFFGNVEKVQNADTILSNLISLGNSYGYNVKSEQIENMLEVGIIDPVKVVRTAFENAVSVANMVIISECLVVEVG